ncbi:Two-component response regulator [Indibacter alkaliphilus LW1]|uniref:Two-component response regulator n=1 Tax=Indibacter alkaliphilus (strain CCUG 57479 / KCTC 22604 / LW1) TaxID=1189612 RepID=S2DES8_INDAL|nr:response regulator [Indibacter alkaliphilus]EOZ95510.1 Two-component response regulator [Indibacter alkaliphilus LW1]
MQPYKSVILVDDDPINNLINKRLITKLSISEKVEEFLEAEKALQKLRSLDPNEQTLILLDINMPVMNGWDFLNVYLKEFPDRKDQIFMLSSSIDLQDRQKAMEFSVVKGFVEKPLTPDKMKNIV